MASMVVALVAIELVVFATPAHANPHLPTVSSTRSWMAQLRASWNHMDVWTRSEIAHLWGVQREEDATETLRSCVRKQDLATASCVVALGALQDVEATPLLRQVLRKNEDPSAIGAAAMTLSAFDDRFSRDLILHTLFKVQGG